MDWANEDFVVPSMLGIAFLMGPAITGYLLFTGISVARTHEYTFASNHVVPRVRLVAKAAVCRVEKLVLFAVAGTACSVGPFGTC